MRVSTREMMLGWYTLIVLLLGFGYWYAEPKYNAWKESKDKLEALNQLKMRHLQVLDRKPKLDEDFNNVSSRVPSYPQDEEIDSRYMRTVDQKADPFGLNILRQDASDEESVGELSTLSVNCSWEGELDALVRFLYSMQIETEMADFQQLSISPSRTAAQRLKGNFEVHFAFKREGI